MSSRHSRKEDKGRVAYLITKPRKPSQSPSLPVSKDNENCLSMFRFAFLLILALAIACSVFGSSGAAPAKPASCQTDNECDEGQYCYKRYTCTDCLDCSSYNRMPGIGQCATARAECGECLPGFVKVGNQCSRNAKDITTSKYPNSVVYIPPKKPTSAHKAHENSIFEDKNVGNINHTREVQNDNLLPPGHNIWIVIGTSAILSVMVVTGLVMVYCRRPLIVRAGPRNKDEEMEPMNQPMSGGSSSQGFGGDDKGPTAADLSPSAPPEEYLQKPPAYWSGSLKHAQRIPIQFGKKVPKLTGPNRVVTQMADVLPVAQAGGLERLVPETYQQANPFSLGNAAGPEAQAFLADHNLEQEALYEEGPDAVLDLLQNALHPPPPVQPPAQLVPEVDPENPQAAGAGYGLNEESMDLDVFPQGNEDDDQMDVDEGIQDNEFVIRVRLDVLAAVIPADGQGIDPVDGNAHDEEADDSGFVDDAVVPGSPSTSRSVAADNDNNPSDDNNNNNNNGRPVNINQPPPELVNQLLDEFNVQLVNLENWDD